MNHTMTMPKFRRLKHRYRIKFRRFIKHVSVFRQKYMCHICENHKPFWKMVQYNIFNQKASSNVCKGCWHMTGETPFFTCEVCFEGKPYDRMIRTGKKTWICTGCENPSGVATNG